MKRDRRTSFFLTLILIFMFAVFGGGSALGIIKLPFLSMLEDATSAVSNTANKNEPESPGINIPTGIQLYDPQIPVSSKIEDIDSESSTSEDIKDTNTEKEGAYLVELSGSTGASSSSPAATSSKPAPGQNTGNSSNSSSPSPADPGTESSSNSSSSSSGGTVIPSTRPKPSEGGGSHSVTVQSVTLDQSDVTINRKNTLQLTATVAPQNATNKIVTWTTSNKDVADVDSSGKVTAIGAGTVTITATAGQKTATCQVTVVVLMDGIALNHTELAIDKGNTEQLTAKITPEDTTDDKTITWTSTSPEVVSVDAAGKVTALKPGKATIRASAVGASASCEITVLSPMTGIALDKSFLTLNRNTTSRLTASFLPEDATGDRTVTWSSTAPSIADVDQNGNIVASTPGTAYITARCGEFTSICTVTVIAQIDGVYLDQSAMVVDRGTDSQLTATILPLDTTEDKTITWASSNPDVATVDATGKVTGIKIGKATITAQVGTHTTTCSISVVALIHGISLDKTELTLDRGTTGQLAVAYDPPDTTDDKTVTWSSSAPDVATVDASGKVTGAKIGAAIITAKVGEHTASCTINVVALIHSISMDKTELTLDRGTTGQLTVSIDPPDTTEDKTVAWTSSDPDVATVDSTGKVTALKIGAATITAAIGEHTTSCTVNVVALIQSIALDKSTLTVDRGSTEQLTVSYSPADTTESKVVNWSSSDPSIAAVDSSGEVTGVKIGTATITAKVGAHTASSTITVVALIKSIVLDKISLTLDRGTTGQLTVSINPADTTESKAVTWSSSNTDIATVDSAGKVTAVKIGTATVTAKVGTHTASCTINVVALIKSISLNKTYINLDKGSSDQLTVSFDPVDTTEAKTIAWTSSNPAIASVDSTGKVTAGISQVGETTITARIGTHTATCVVGVGVKFTVTTESGGYCYSTDLSFNSDGSGRFDAWDRADTEKHGYGKIKITFSRSITIPKNNTVAIKISYRTTDGSLATDGEVNLEGQGDNNSHRLTVGTWSWSVSQTETTYVQLNFSATVKANSKEDGYFQADWDSGNLVIFGTPITGKTGYLDL